MAHETSLLPRLVYIGAAVVAMALLLVVVGRWASGSDEFERSPPPPSTSEVDPPIPTEAIPHRERARQLAVDAEVEPRPEAQTRRLEIYRRLRAYPGAPPRIPHGLTDREFLEMRCNSCHERGGYVPRFNAYAPVTPHPEFTDCLQCHAPEAMNVGLGIPRLTDDVICGQCHVHPDEPPPSLVSLDWQPMEWPALGQRATDESPPMIPHRLHLREDCVACHGGPWAVREIRTTHPGRTDCRSCHVVDDPDGVPGGEGDVFSRPLEMSREERGTGR